MTEQTTERSVFGSALAALMEARGIDAAEPEQVKALAERSGLDGEGLLANFRSERGPDLGELGGLAEELALTGREMTDVAMAYAYEERVPCG